MLHLMSAMQSAVGGRKERSKVAFRLEALHIDLSSAFGGNALLADGHQDIAVACHIAAGPECKVHIVPLEAVFLDDMEAVPLGSHDPSEFQDARRKLQELLGQMKDVTGREDLVHHLRDHLLRRATAHIGAGKLLLGMSLTQCAISTIEGMCKGKGYALPGAIQYRDARHGSKEPIVGLPVRDISSKELGLLCHYKQLAMWPPPTVASPSQMTKSIHHLTANFVVSLQEHLTSSVSNILGTATKLEPFPFNAVPQRDRGRMLPVPPGPPSKTLCPTCDAPLSDRELTSVALLGSGSVGCLQVSCFTCQASILKDLGLAGAELPKTFQQRAEALCAAVRPAIAAGNHVSAESTSVASELRKQIGDCLIDSDSDDDNKAFSG